MIISWILSYLLLSGLTLVLWEIYHRVVSNNFAKAHFISPGKYLDFQLKYIDALPDAKWYVICIRVLFIPIWFPLRTVKIIKDMEKAYLDSIK